MDNQSLIILFGGFGFFAILSAVLKSNSKLIKGWVGEFYVNFSAKRFLDNDIYHLIKNVTLPTEDSTTQIDHIIVSRYGIFVVETKNMAGWIFGGEHQCTWTQHIYKHKTTFQNPLRQNHGHKKALEEILGIVPAKIFSVIVFVGDSHFKTEMPANVTYARGYIDYIKSKQEPLFGDYEVQEIIDKIEQYRLKSGLKTHLEHVENVKRKHSPNPTRVSRASRGISPITKTAVAAIIFLVVATIAKNNFIDTNNHQNQASRTPRSSTHQNERESVQHQIEKTSPGQNKNEKIYAYKDSTGRLNFSNVAVPADGKLVQDTTIIKKEQNSVPIEISDNKIYVPVTIGHNGKQMTISLLLDRESNKTVLPMRIADFVNADNVRVTSTPIVRGKVIQGNAKRIDYFNVGTVIENHFIITATNDTGIGNRGILGMDFIVRHPFSIDMQSRTLAWK